jgi:hypothetical protein
MQLSTGKNAVAGPSSFSWNSGTLAFTNYFSTSQRNFNTISRRAWMSSAWYTLHRVDCSAFGQSGTGPVCKKKADAGASPVSK